MSEVTHINYRLEPKKFSNRAMLDRDILSQVGGLAQGDSIEAETLIALAVLAETVVFNEKIIITDDIGIPEAGASSHSQGAQLYLV